MSETSSQDKVDKFKNALYFAEKEVEKIEENNASPNTEQFIKRMLQAETLFGRILGKPVRANPRNVRESLLTSTGEIDAERFYRQRTRKLLVVEKLHADE
jgi:Zn-dependent oligopeptidase